MTITYRKEFINKQLTIVVKIGIFVGIITSLLMLVLMINFFNVSAFKQQQAGSTGTPLVIRDRSGCQINPFQIDLSPTVVISNTNDYIYPGNGTKKLTIARGQSVDFVCPGGAIIIAPSQGNQSVLSGTCVNGSIFKTAKAEINWRDLKCADYPVSTIRYTGNSCENNGREIEIGFEIAKNRFLRSMLICFDQEQQIAYYTYVKLPASINQRIWNTPRPKFQQGSGFYNIGKVDNLYNRKKQKVTINRLLGLPDNSTKYVQDNTDYFLSRGHLTANMDNFYAAQQRATFYFQNVAPQWQTFNRNNWNQIEIDVRDYAEHNAVDLQVWTGVYGVATLPHETTRLPIKLFLFVDNITNRTALPIPEIYWKVVFNPLNQRGVALIGANNPYNSSLVKICPDVSLKLTWLHFNRTDQLQGFCYACSIENFRKVVTFLPKISDKGLLV